VDQQFVRRPAVAGTWYPGSVAALAAEVDRHLESAPGAQDSRVLALVVPHAGLMYSGAVAAHAYRVVAGLSVETIVLVGPSHYVAFDGVAIQERGAFETPLGLMPIDRGCAAALLGASSVIRSLAEPHTPEHSLEMQLPFLQRVLPGVPIVPLLMGRQTRETILALADALGAGLAGRRTLLVASTDLSHFFDAATAAALDGRVTDRIGRCDPDGLLAEFERYPEAERGRYVACGGGPAVAVLRGARALGAVAARVLRYGHSGEVSGDCDRVVGYAAAALLTADSPSGTARADAREPRG
jgi:MEMO1 family protein